MIEDTFGHKISYLRVSITDRCNERCLYCMPEEGQAWMPREDLLSYEEVERVCRVAATLGVSKLRVTGGEPLIRRGAIEFVRRLSAIEGIKNLGVSTNGSLLSDPEPGARPDTTRARCLAAAGVHSVNISLDGLDARSYAATTGRDYLGKVISGIRAARSEGLSVKLNAVLMKNRSEAQLLPLLDFAREEGALLRFIELMPVTDALVLDDERFLSSGLARKIIELRTGPLRQRPDFRTNGPASYYEVASTGQLIGFISALSDLHFCDSCNKLRLTCDGKLRPCLGSHLEVDLRDALRAGADDEEIARLFKLAVHRKPETHAFRESYQPGRHMIAIGG
jgi:cyclic pyranopterin phosphate synthase